MVDVATSDGFSMGKPTVLFAGRYRLTGRDYAGRAQGPVAGRGGLWLFDPSTGEAKVIVDNGSSVAMQARISPDARWLAPVADESGN